MTTARDTHQGRNRMLGTDTEKVNITFPREVYEALSALAAEEYDAIGTCARRLVVGALREKGKL